jgi:dUTP pyrophosphatase
VNLSEENFVIKDGERIGQMVIEKHEKAEWITEDNVIEIERGTGGFGHTGKK